MLNKFLDEVCSHVRCKSAHKEIRIELMGHIEELQNEGMSLEAAISTMGNCAEIGSRLNKQHRPQIEWSLIGLVAFISGIGVIMMFWGNDSRISGSFPKYIFGGTIGVLFAVCIMFFDYTKIKKLAMPLYISSIVFLIFGLITGLRLNGVTWIPIGAITLSTSLAIIPFILSFVGFANKFRGEGVRGFAKLIILGAISIISMLLVSGMANALILFGSYAVLLFVAVHKNHFEGNVKLQKILLHAGSLLIVVIMGIFITQSDPAGGDWINIQLANLLSISKLWGGVGTIDGYTPNHFFPDLTTTFALANVIITFGWLVGAALILAIISLIVRLFLVTRKIKNDFGFYLTLVACIVLSMQFIISVLMNLGLLGLFPLTDMSLPFVSYGGSAYISNMVLIGLILSVWRKNNIIGSTAQRGANMQTEKSL
jgi:cell division protein FtsW (lipid II flippase)